jgi:NAD(P)-dependent dehydrogenase (short-subunit alcohol dehydrogenase family)
MESFTKFAGLENALVLVTGGATGISSDIVETFARQGSRVISLDLRRKNHPATNQPYSLTLYPQSDAYQ